MKNILKIAALTLLSGMIIWFLAHKNLIHFELIKSALAHSKWLIIGIAVLQIFNYFSMGLRYQVILKTLNFKQKFKNVIAATFIGNGLGQWLPGSLAFIEVIRVGLMTKSINQSENAQQEVGHLAIASLFDRLIGLFIGLFIGTLICIYFIITLKQVDSAQFLILLLVSGFNGFMCLLILLLPLFAGSKLMQHILARGERMCLHFISHPKFHSMIIAFFHKTNALIKFFAKNGRNYKLFFIPMGLSLCSFLGFAFSLQVASYALGTTIPFLVTLCIVAILSVITALPISVGGIGAPQLITAILFGAFGANSAQAASAQFLQTGITLITISLCALLYLPRMMKEIIKPRIA